ncbi:MAG: radical SAM family heme chaperone HemW [Desulfobulbaceae bacterium]|nr:radical SAM family heme chaperone HemW [Desulfobulbaceae bacterium]
MSSLYIHIPFCLKKCHYCSFSSGVADLQQYSHYVSALKKELESIAAVNNGTPINTLFLGGGTPTCLSVNFIKDIISHCLNLFGVTDNAEISVEANPGTVDTAYFESLLAAGVNRISLGIQSFDNDQLKAIGRIHSGGEAKEAFKSAQKAGFENINLDLMYGLPGQSEESWKSSLLSGLNLQPTHLSLYQLTVEENTRFFDLVTEGRVELPDVETILLMDEITLRETISHNFQQYETSNFCLPGYSCRHNINYWNNDEYMAAGASAVSFIAGCREKRLSYAADYIAAIRNNTSVIAESETLEVEASFRESVIMGLRMVEGVSISSLWKKYKLKPDLYYGAVLARLIESGLVKLTDTHLLITKRGWPLSNRIMAELV